MKARDIHELQRLSYTFSTLSELRVILLDLQRLGAIACNSVNTLESVVCTDL